MPLGDTFYPTSPYTPGEHPGVDRLEQTHGNTVFLGRSVSRRWGVIGGYVDSHRDADLESQRVALYRAEEIIFDDGLRLNIPSLAYTLLPLSLRIDATGAGGLDTGAATNGRWYQPWVIAKGDPVDLASDVSTLFSLMANRAAQVAQNSNDQVLTLRSADSNREVAQSVSALTAARLRSVDLFLQRTGTPTGQIWVELQADNAGNPSGAALATSDRLDATRLSTTAARFIRFPFAGTFDLAAGTTYWLVVRGSYALSAGNYVGVSFFRASNQYANGQMKRNNAGAWTVDNANDDLTLQLFTETFAADPVLPTGYTRKTRMGPPFFYTGGVLQKQRSIGARVTPHAAQGIYTGTDTVPTLVDLRSFVPPIPVRLTVGGRNSAAANTCLLGTVPCGAGMVLNLTPRSQFGATYFRSLDSTDYAERGCIDVGDFQAAYTLTSGGTLEWYVDSWEVL